MQTDDAARMSSAALAPLCEACRREPAIFRTVHGEVEAALCGDACASRFCALVGPRVSGTEPTGTDDREPTDEEYLDRFAFDTTRKAAGMESQNVVRFMVRLARRHGACPAGALVLSDVQAIGDPFDWAGTARERVKELAAAPEGGAAAERARRILAGRDDRFESASAVGGATLPECLAPPAARFVVVSLLLHKEAVAQVRARPNGTADVEHELLSGHANMLLVDTHERVVERFEPQAPVEGWKDVEARVRAVLSRTAPSLSAFEYVDDLSACGLSHGPQTREELYAEDDREYRPGFCASWSLLYMAARLQRPDASRYALVLGLSSMPAGALFRTVSAFRAALFAGETPEVPVDEWLAGGWAATHSDATMISDPRAFNALVRKSLLPVQLPRQIMALAAQSSFLRDLLFDPGGFTSHASVVRRVNEIDWSQTVRCPGKARWPGPGVAHAIVGFLETEASSPRERREDTRRRVLSDLSVEELRCMVAWMEQWQLLGEWRARALANAVLDLRLRAPGHPPSRAEACALVHLLLVEFPSQSVSASMVAFALVEAGLLPRGRRTLDGVNALGRLADDPEAFRRACSALFRPEQQQQL